MRRIFGCLLAALLTAGCAAEEAPEKDQALVAVAPTAQASSDCLLLVWQQQASPDQEFDSAHDLTQGGAISCATGTSASQFESALAAIREAARRGDKSALLAQLGIPLLYIDETGNRRELEQPERVQEVFDEVFTPATMALLERVRLEDLTVVAGQGAFVELGSVWLVVDEPGGRPRIATVNQQALGEAAAAAREAAAEGQTRPAPMTS